MAIGRKDGFIKLAHFRAGHAYAYEIFHTKLAFLNRTACGKLPNGTTDNLLLYGLVSAMKSFSVRTVSRIHAGLSPVPETVRLIVQTSENGFARMMERVQPEDTCPSMVTSWIWEEFIFELRRFHLQVEIIDSERIKSLRGWAHNVMLNPWPNTRIERPRYVAHFGDPSQLFTPGPITA